MAAKASSPPIPTGMDLVNSLLNAVAVTDGEGTIVLTNESWSRFANDNGADSRLASGVGLNYLDTCRAASRSGSAVAGEVLSGIEDVLSGKRQQFCAEYSCDSPTERRWFLLQVTGLRSPVQGAVLLHLNITGRKLVEERLESLHKEKTHWLAIAAHDLRNPVAAIMANAELLEQEFAGVSAERCELLKNISTSGEFLLKLLDDLLDLSAIESGAPGFRPERIDLRSVIEESIALVQHTASRKGIRIETCYPEAIPLLNLDRVQMTQVLFNLLGNAIKFSPTDATLNIGIRLAAAKVVLQVQDNGPGIPPDGLESIFMPFYRLAQASSERGTGLGLAICRRIVERHGGRIWAENASVRGTVFRVSLPICETPERPQTQPKAT